MTFRSKPIHAFIGVWRRGAETYYVKRSQEMSNYKGVWSLFSQKFDPMLVATPKLISSAQPYFAIMAEQRLFSFGYDVERYLTSGSSNQNPMGVEVTLYLFEMQFAYEPLLNPRYYTDGAWMTAEQYEEVSKDQPCGLCTRLWADYAWMAGITDQPFRGNHEPS